MTGLALNRLDRREGLVLVQAVAGNGCRALLRGGERLGSASSGATAVDPGALSRGWAEDILPETHR